MNARNNKLIGLAALGLTGALTLSACGGGNGGGEAGNGGAGGEGTQEGMLSGQLAGAGASSMQTAQTAWTESFMALNPETQVTYDPVGSGTGREQFLNGGVSFAGTDAALNEEETAASAEVCAGGEAFNLPVYISPIAVVFNLPGIDSLNLTPEAIGGIFAGDITTWNDPAIAEHNPDVDLPESEIVPVHRSDDSGTTENFTEYLDETSGGAWPHGVVETWPISGGQSGNGTSGLVSVVEGAEGTIGYADASQAGNLGTAAIQVGEQFVEYSPEAAAAAVEASPREEGRSENDIVVDLDRATTEEGVYPLVLISYQAMCDTYEDPGTAELVSAYTSYVISPEGQQYAADNAGSAPLTESLASDAQASVDNITSAG